MAKGAYSQRSTSNSQHRRSGSQPTVTLVPGDLMHSSDLHRHRAFTWYTYIHIYLHTCTPTYMYPYMHARLHACTLTYMYTYMHAHLHTCTITYMHLNMCTLTYIQTNIQIRQTFVLIFLNIVYQTKHRVLGYTPRDSKETPGSPCLHPDLHSQISSQ